MAHGLTGTKFKMQKLEITAKQATLICGGKREVEKLHGKKLGQSVVQIDNDTTLVFDDERFYIAGEDDKVKEVLARLKADEEGFLYYQTQAKTAKARPDQRCLDRLKTARLNARPRKKA